MAETSDDFFEKLLEFRKSSSYQTRLRVPDTISWMPICRELDEVADTYKCVALSIDDNNFKTDLKKAAARCTTLSQQIWGALTLSDNESVVYIDVTPKGPVLCSKPIRVADRLQRHLFEQTKCVVLTSATLSTNDSFQYIVSELGVPEPRVLDVASPFDFQEQAVMIVPDNLPFPNNPAFIDVIGPMFSQILDFANGRTLGLFTSYRNLNIVYEYLRNSKYTILKQGEMPRSALLQKFKEDVHSVLLGTDSFWAGVDVPGKALSCVVIDRLPFPNPDDPILDAITEQEKQWFQKYCLPRAVITFKQGFGRLIRKSTDRGVLVVLDRRLSDKSYGRVFSRSLPSLPRSRFLKNISRWLGEVK